MPPGRSLQAHYSHSLHPSEATGTRVTSSRTAPAELHTASTREMTGGLGLLHKYLKCKVGQQDCRQAGKRAGV